MNGADHHTDLHDNAHHVSREKHIENTSLPLRHMGL
jgi:hypothetical protein